MSFLTIQYYRTQTQRSKARRRWFVAALVAMPLLLIAGWLLRDAIHPSQAAAGINQQLTYQGKVADSGGLPLTTGAYNFLFLIYSAPTGGSPLWSESWTSTTTAGAVPVVNGVFTAPLGTSTSLSAIDFNSNSLYLEVRFDADSNGSFEETFSPRKRLTSSPYAFNAGQVNGLIATTTATAGQLLALDSNAGMTLGGVTTTGAIYAGTKLSVATTSNAALAVNGSVYFQGANFATTTIGSNTSYLSIGAAHFPGGNLALPTLSGSSFGTDVGDTHTVGINNQLTLLEDPSLNSGPSVAFIANDLFSTGNFGLLTFTTSTRSFTFDQTVNIASSSTSTLSFHDGDAQIAYAGYGDQLNFQGANEYVFDNWAHVPKLSIGTTTYPGSSALLVDSSGVFNGVDFFHTDAIGDSAAFSQGIRSSYYQSSSTNSQSNSAFYGRLYPRANLLNGEMSSAIFGHAIDVTNTGQPIAGVKGSVSYDDGTLQGGTTTQAVYGGYFSNFAVSSSSYGVYGSVDGIDSIGDGNNYYGVYGTANKFGPANINYGVYASALGGGTNYAGYFDNGDVYIKNNLGIGTSTPGSLLSVGDTNGINFSEATSTFSSTGGINLLNGCFAVNGVCISGSSGSPGGNPNNIQFNDGGTFNGSDLFSWDNSAEQLSVTGKGGVAIGTNIGSEINGQALSAILSDDESPYVNGVLGIKVQGGGLRPENSYVGAGGIAIISSSTASAIGVYGAASGGLNNWAGYFQGNVEVQDGFVSSTQFCLNGDCISSWGAGSSQWDTVTGGINYAGGNVGVGSSTPYAKLSITPDAQYGSQEISNPAFTGNATGWNLGTDWAYTSDAIEHTPGTTDVVTQTGTLTEGGEYRVQVLMSGGTAGTIDVCLDGGTCQSVPYNVAPYFSWLGTWSNTDGVKVKITPSSDFDGSIVAVSVTERLQKNPDFIIDNQDTYSLKVTGYDLYSVYPNLFNIPLLTGKSHNGLFPDTDVVGVKGGLAILPPDQTSVLFGSDPRISFFDPAALGGGYISYSTTTREFRIDQDGATTTIAADYVNLVGSGCYAINGVCISNSSQWETDGNDIFYHDGNVGILNDTLPSIVLGNADGVDIAGMTYGNMNDSLNFVQADGGYAFDNFIAVSGTATSTFSWGIQTTDLNVTGSATSTFANGIALASGCITVGGVCIGSDGSYSTTSADYWLSTKTTDYLPQGSTNLYSQWTGSLTGMISHTGSVNIDQYSSYYINSAQALYATSTSIMVGGGGSLNSGAQLNTVVGFGALSAATSSDNNTAIGYGALNVLTLGHDNTAVGTYALYVSTSSIANTAIGVSALFQATSGGGNVAIGNSAMAASTIGSSNVAIGLSALGNGVNPTESVAIGRSALYNATNIDNIGIGMEAGYNLGNGHHNIVIGAHVDLPNNAGTQQLNIGNLIYGTNIYGDSSNSSNPVVGKIGIASSTPWATLSVSNYSAGASTAPLFAIASSTGSGATSTPFIVDKFGNVGIGTSSPVSTLSIQGSLCVRDTGTCGTTAGTIYATTAAITDIDLAENYQAFDTSLEPGSIVAITTENAGGYADDEGFGVKKAASGDNVIGIISTAPGIVLGKEKSHSVPVALSGRVPVKVTNAAGPITAGDYITVSSVAGVGQKALPGDQIVGMALESYDSAAVGRIMAFVQLGEPKLTVETTPSTNNNPTAPIVVTQATSTLNELTVQTAATFYGTITVQGTANFVSRVTFAASAEFKKSITVSADTAGTATIKAGATTTKIIFSEPYEQEPRVTIAPLALTDHRYAVIEKSLEGFTITIDSEAEEDLAFDWIALGSKTVETDPETIVTSEVIPTPPTTSTTTEPETPPAQSGDTPPAETPIPDTQPTAPETVTPEPEPTPTDTPAPSADTPAPSPENPTPSPEAPAPSA